MELVKAINSNRVLRCSCCGKPVRGWYFYALPDNEMPCLEFSLCRSCADVQLCDIIQAVIKRKVWWHKRYQKPLQVKLLTGGFAATLKHLLAGEEKNETTC